MRHWVGSVLNRVLEPRLRANLASAFEQESRDIARRLQMVARDESAELVRKEMGGAHSFRDPESVLRHACEVVAGPDSEGLVLEFGVWRGTTVNRLAAAFPGRTVYGFDSFAGLPEDWRDGFPRGHFRLPEPPRVDPNVCLVVGRFEDTLPAFVAAHEERVALLHVDCDLYSSTATVLKALRPRLTADTVIVFDEYFNYPGWQGNEHRALCEFAANARVKYEYLAYNSQGEQVAVRLASVEADESPEAAARS
ncbi:MAG TPA: TylF/MycF/NovP-related O-methyltransferase [Anaeromyxobacteraceae bacterium]|nr:TylF/MycF/NovP-related O-methyltransferase [Anaeromyxobacteraceae bacterium]